MGDSTGVLDPQQAVDQLFGVGRAQVIEAVTSTKVTETEVILVNGTPVKLVGEDGALLKEALLEGRLPEQGLLNRVLSSVLGDLKGITKVESEVSLTSSVTTKDTLSVLQNGKVINEKTSEWQSNSEAFGRCSETFQKPCTQPAAMFASSGVTNTRSTSSASSLNSSSPRPSSRNGKASSSASRASSTPSPLNGFPYNINPESQNASFTSGSQSSVQNPSHTRIDNLLGKGLSSRDSGIARSSSSNVGRDLTPEDIRKSSSHTNPFPQSNGLQLDLGSTLTNSETKLNKNGIRRPGPCLSPDLEESLARTTLKDSICRSGKAVPVKDVSEPSFQEGEYVNIHAFKK